VRVRIYPVYTRAEAPLQGLQAMWELPLEGYSWATAGYMGPFCMDKPYGIFWLAATPPLDFDADRGRRLFHRSMKAKETRAGKRPAISF
jgi:hypothetical protein